MLHFYLENSILDVLSVTFFLSGNLSPTRSKLNYNLKIRGGNELYGN